MLLSFHKTLNFPWLQESTVLGTTHKAVTLLIRVFPVMQYTNFQGREQLWTRCEFHDLD